jgi:hypothetical protein
LGAGAIRPIPEPVRLKIAEPLAHAFTGAFWWAVGLTAVAVLPSIVLAAKARQAPAPAPTVA